MDIFGLIGENWVEILTVLNSIVVTTLAVIEFRRKKFGPHLDIECNYPENFKLNLIKHPDDFQYFILKATLTNNGSETALVNHLTLFPPLKIEPSDVKAWDGSVHVKEVGNRVGKEFRDGVLSQPRVSTPFGLKPKEHITLYFLIKPKKDYHGYNEIKAEFYLNIYYSKDKELHWGPINLFWASEEKIAKISMAQLNFLLDKTTV